MRYAWLSLLLTSVMLMASCSMGDRPKLSAEESVKVKALARWEALIAGKLETAYEFATPEYRKVFTFEQFRRGIYGVGTWKKAEVSNVACVDNCVVTMRIHVTITTPRLGDTIETSSLLKEQWTQDKGSGEWFYLSSE